MRTPPFYLVWSPSGDRPPSFRHPDERSAEMEAERLAREHPGREFYVLAPTYTVCAQKMLVERFATGDIPF